MAWEFIFSSDFTKHSKALSEVEKKQLAKALRLLAESPMYPSLRAKQIQGSEGLYECSVNMDIRIIWYYRSNGVIAIVDVGHHDILDKY